MNTPTLRQVIEALSKQPDEILDAPLWYIDTGAFSSSATVESQLIVCKSDEEGVTVIT